MYASRRYNLKRDESLNIYIYIYIYSKSSKILYIITSLLEHQDGLLNLFPKNRDREKSPQNMRTQNTTEVFENHNG
jgi:hypothetical protein